ncbi:MAG: hypothetical protein ACK5T6_18635 [Pirellula sp.]
MPLTWIWNGMCELFEVVRRRWKRRDAENAEWIPLVVLCGERKCAHHVDGSTGTNND